MQGALSHSFLPYLIFSALLLASLLQVPAVADTGVLLDGEFDELCNACHGSYQACTLTKLS